MNRLTVMLVVFLFVSAPLIAGIWTNIKPAYQARCEIHTEPMFGGTKFYLEPVLQRVLDQDDVRETQWYRSPRRSIAEICRRNFPTPKERLRKGLSVRPRLGTGIIDLSFTDFDARSTAVIVNAVAEQWVEYVAENAEANADAVKREMMRHCRTMESEIAVSEKLVAERRHRFGTDTPQTLISSKRASLDKAQACLKDLRMKIVLMEWHVKHVEIEDNNDVATVPAGRPEQWQDWTSAEGEVSLEHQLAQAKREEPLLREDVDRQIADYRGLFENVQLFAREDFELELNRRSFEVIRKRLEQYDIEHEKPAAVELLRRADVPTELYKDHRIALTAGTLILGLCAAIAGLSMRRRMPVETTTPQGTGPSEPV